MNPELEDQTWREEKSQPSITGGFFLSIKRIFHILIFPDVTPWKMSSVSGM